MVRKIKVYRIDRNLVGKIWQIGHKSILAIKNLVNESKQRMPTLNLDGFAIKILANFPNSPNFGSTKISSYSLNMVV